MNGGTMPTNHTSTDLMKQGFSGELSVLSGTRVSAYLRLLINSSVEEPSPGKPGGGAKLRRV
jgi:hypothetical protein